MSDDVKKQNDQSSKSASPPSLAELVPALAGLENEFLVIYGGMRVAFKPTGIKGTVTHLGVLIDFPNSFGIQAVIRWDDGKSGYYNATDFSRNGTVQESVA